MQISNNKNDDILEYIKDIDSKLNTNDFDSMKKLCKTLIDKIVITNENIDIHYKI